jgi:ABC-type Fe3+ transport system substrate-binding protein
MQGEGKLTFLGKFVVFVFLSACFVGAYFMFVRPSGGGSGGGTTGRANDPPSGGGDSRTPADGGERGGASSAVNGAPEITIGIAYGTEKRRWLTWAVEEWGKSPDGRRIGVELIPLGSIEGAHEILKGNTKIHVWSPASGLYRHNLVGDWELKNAGANPIAEEDPLAFTPMVFVMWEERYQAFVTKYQELSFKTIAQALAEPGGWKAIANKPEWGFFKFGHTNPNQSNSGLMALVLLGYDYFEKSRGLTMGDITTPAFQDWSRKLQGAVSGLSNSTGNMMTEMVQRGPSTYDALLVYENTAMELVKNAEGRWGRLRIVYPTRNAWNDNPYYVLNVPWSGSDHKAAAGKFREFLLSERVQSQAIVHGFRPANVQVPIVSPESQFTQLEGHGVRIDLPDVCEVPPADVISNLLLSWQRSRGS